MRFKTQTIGRSALAAITAIALASYANANGALTTEKAIANVKAAVFTKDANLRETLVMSGAVTHVSITGGYTFEFAPTGQFRETMSGMLGQTTGFDGKVLWLINHGGTPGLLFMDDRDTSLAQAFFEGGAWLLNRSLTSVSLDQAGVPVKQVGLKVRLKDGLIDYLVIVDPKTWLPQSATYKVGGVEHVISLSDYKLVRGRRVPFGFVDKSNDNSTAVHIDKVEAVKSDPSHFADSMHLPADTHFDSNIPADVPITKAISGHLLVKPLINGKDVGWFIFDTGAGSQCIDPKVADELKLPEYGKEALAGVVARLSTTFRQADTMQLGPMTMDHPFFLTLDLEQIGKALGIKLAGVVGYDFFSRGQMLIDTKGNKISIWAPNTWSQPAPWQQLLTSGGSLAAKVKFDGVHEDTFGIDLGSAATLDIFSGGLKRYPHFKDKTDGTGSTSGAGGGIKTAVATLDSFTFGGREFKKIRVALDNAEVGAAVNDYLAGNIGLGILREFKLMLDYPNRRIAFLPNP